MLHNKHIFSFNIFVCKLRVIGGSFGRKINIQKSVRNYDMYSNMHIIVNRGHYRSIEDF